MIYFRTRYSASVSAGSSDRYMYFGGNEWSHLQTYTIGDDARNIVWKKSTGKDIIAKVHASKRQIQLSFISLPQSEDFFLTPAFPVSKHTWKENSIQLLVESAKSGRHQYTRLKEDGIQTLLKKHTKHSLVIILAGHNIVHSPTLPLLAHMNDVLVVIPYHEWELHPDTEYMIDTKVWDHKQQEAYQKAFAKWQHDIKKRLGKHNINTLFLSTKEPITNGLNHFFKHRYG